MACELPKIVKGSSKTLTLRFRDRETGDVYDLTGATITVKFPKTDGTCVSKSATVTDATNGVATVSLSTTETATLQASSQYDFEAEVVISGNTDVVVFLNALNVEERVCD